MSGDRLNLTKPCTACRRRKVRCDKNQPCQNCVKHSVSCVYEGDSSGGGLGGDQTVLHERIDKLEKIILQMSAANSSAGKSPCRRSPEIESPSRSSRDSDESSPRGVLVTEPHVSYYMNPNFWINQQDFVLEPRYLTQVGFDDVQESAWPFGIASPMPSSLAHMHLPIEKENFILDEFWRNVEPFVRIAHRSTWKADLAEFRRGAHVLERVFEAAIFSQQLLAIASMTQDRVQQLFGQSRRELITHFRAATEMAMMRANILRSRVIMAFQVLLYYITFLYTTGQSEHGSNIVLLAGRVGMRMGLHRDPRHYNLSPWVGEMRRRMWNHLLLMDNQPFSGEGSEAVLDLVSNVYRSTNANDEDWVPTRFAKADTGAQDKEGWTELTFPIIRQEILGSQRRVAKLKAQGATPESIYRSLDDDDAYVSRKYLTHLDESEPIQMVTLSRARAYMRWFRFQIDMEFSKPPAGKEPNKDQQARLFREAIEVMEEIHRGENIAAANNWGWVYNWPVPWSMIAFLLSCLSQQPDHPDVDRAWSEVEVCFRKYTSSDVQTSKLPAWRAIEQLCDRAMYCHSSRMHSNAAYAQRVLPNDLSASQPLDPSLTSSNLHDPLFGDVSMLPALPDTDFTMQQIFGAVSTGVSDQDSVPNQMMYSDWTSTPQRITSTPFLQ